MAYYRPLMNNPSEQLITYKKIADNFFGTFSKYIYTIKTSPIIAVIYIPKKIGNKNRLVNQHFFLSLRNWEKVTVQA